MRAGTVSVGVAIVLAGALAGCEDASVPTPPAAAPTSPGVAAPASPEAPEVPQATARAGGAAGAEVERLAQANEAARRLGLTLKTRLVAAMSEGGPAAAVEVCATQAQDLTAAVGASSGVLVGRSSLRLRNPRNAPPDWVRAWLEAQGERPAAGTDGISAVVDTPSGRRARVLLPIAVEPPCLVCHGAPSAIPRAVRSILAERYPEDRATGYAEGDLRGALFAEASIE